MSEIDPETLVAEILPAVRKTFEERIPFNHLLGLKVRELTPERVVLAWDKKPEQVGNFALGILHGGVISAALDATGGLVAMVNALRRLKGYGPEERAAILSKIGTIDMRVDFLRRGEGESFYATGYILRTGSRVAVTRMELHNDKDRLIATGTGTYIVS